MRSISIADTNDASVRPRQSGTPKAIGEGVVDVRFNSAPLLVESIFMVAIDRQICLPSLNTQSTIANMRTQPWPRLLRLAAPLGLLALTACPPESHVVFLGARQADLTFVFSQDEAGERPLEIELVNVSECRPQTPAQAPRVFWRIAGPPTVLSRVRLGVAPPGFRTDVAARTMPPGCYNLIAGGGGWNFTVGEDGVIKPPRR
jgi:hypothetical protein